MNKKFLEFTKFRRRGKLIVFLFCLNIIFLFLSLTVISLQTKQSNPLIVVLLSVSTLCFLAAILIIKLNWGYIRKLEAHYANTYLNMDTQRLQIFHRLLDENLFEYHFQPIIDAKTGKVFAYEALMRTNAEIGMSPLEILDYANKENRLYEIEKLTFFNTLRIMKENSDIFNSKKLFINSISNNLLSNEDYDALHKEYESLFKSVVLEITESSLIDDKGIQSIQKRLHDANSQLALDDYGTGFSNESILLKTNPNYIKIDQKILRNINTDSKKQHLVSNIISFATKNHIKTIAEGIETYEEFVYVINLGIDYIQGFYTGRPNPVLLLTIPDECVDTIYAINQKHYLENMVTRVYETNKEEKILSLVSLSLSHYSDVHINEKELTLQGSHGILANTNVHISDNLKCTLTLDNINLQGNGPSISLGYNCDVTLNLIGDNEISNDGIRVPESSSLTIVGDGNLTIRSSQKNGIGIGGNSEQNYGNITLTGTGWIQIFNSGDKPIGIGGAQNTSNSLIRLASGKISIEARGNASVGVGNVYGNANIIIEECDLNIFTTAIDTVSIGCLKGMAHIETCGTIDIQCEGRNIAAIGVLEQGTGNIIVSGGILKLHFNAHSGAGIGGVGSCMDIDIQNGDIDIYSEGTDVVGIGDYLGTGRIRISNGILSTTLYAARPIPIGNTERTIIIDGGNIQCSIPSDYKLINSQGMPLVSRTVSQTYSFKQLVSTKDNSYDYSAEYCDRFPDIKIYLPKEL